MPFTRRETNYFTTLANTGEQKFTWVSQDGYRNRHITKVFVGLAVSGLKIGLYVNGDWKSDIDTTRFANSIGAAPVEFDVPARATFQIALTDLAGSIRTSVPVVIEYEVDSD